MSEIVILASRDPTRAGKFSSTRPKLLAMGLPVTAQMANIKVL